MKDTCTVNDSKECLKCKDRNCGKVSILEIILSSGDARKISQLSAVLGVFGVRVMDLI